MRSLVPLPWRTMISLGSKSMSYTRKRKHSIRRSPVPYMSEAISLLSQISLFLWPSKT